MPVEVAVVVVVAAVLVVYIYHVRFIIEQKRAVWSRGQGLHFSSVRSGVRIPTALPPAWVALRGTLGAGNKYPKVADTPLLVIPQDGPALEVIFYIIS